MDLTILLPTKDEGENITQVIEQVQKVCEQLNVDYEILVMDADSQDETQALAKAAGARVATQKRPAYGGAILDGFDEAKGDFVLTLDADLSHPPALIKELWATKDYADLAIGSRFVPGGKSDMSTSRYVLSRILNTTFGIALLVPIKDMSSGYRLYRKSVVKRFDFSGGNLSILQEMVIKLYLSGYRIVEKPLHYMPRMGGVSKSSALKFGKSYLQTLFRLMYYRYFIPKPKIAAPDKHGQQ